MQSISPSINAPLIEEEAVTTPTNYMVTGFRLRLVRFLIWINIFYIACKEFKDPFKALKNLRQLRKLRNKYRANRSLHKYAKQDKLYYINYNTPGWPSAAFNRYVRHQLSRINGTSASIHTLIFAITKKCGFQCEHCCEWLNLNQPETLSREDLSLVIHRFHSLGIAQVQLSGGEPLNRIDDIYYLLENAPEDIDFWLYTTGYSLNHAKAKLLKKRGLTGITISLDHHVEEKHNEFRGVKDAYDKALRAARIAKEEGLLVCFSICATRSFISETNLFEYAALARDYGVSFIQLLEPKAVGHYAGKDVLLGKEHHQILELFYETMNYDRDYAEWPSVVYHGYNNRHFGCSGSANDYVYADTDGDIHNCPFCYRKHFSAFDEDLPELLMKMKTRGCNALDTCTIK